MLPHQALRALRRGPFIDFLPTPIPAGWHGSPKLSGSHTASRVDPSLGTSGVTGGRNANRTSMYLPDVAHRDRARGPTHTSWSDHVDRQRVPLSLLRLLLGRLHFGGRHVRLRNVNVDPIPLCAGSEHSARVGVGGITLASGHSGCGTGAREVHYMPADRVGSGGSICATCRRAG